MEREISYKIVRSDRKTIAIQIKPDGQVVVRCPKRIREEEIRSFVESKKSWVEKHLAKGNWKVSPLAAEEIEQLKEKTRKKVMARIPYFAPLVGVTYNRVSIRAQHTRWGSCSSKGNLNFNCLLALIPEEVLDYVVVHELCHRKGLNHSDRFWKEVERVLPEYRVQRKWLKENGTEIIGRL